MQFADLDRAANSLVLLALYPLILLVVCSLAAALLAELPAAAELGLVCLLVFLCPIAYLVREERQGGPQRQHARRGAERTPLLPPNEEAE